MVSKCETALLGTFISFDVRTEIISTAFAD